jgi:transmembrane sensor
LCALVVLGVASWPREVARESVALAGPLSALPAQGAAERAPVVLGGGVEIAIETPLSDGSKISPRKGTRLAVLENTASRFVTLLGAGRAEFAVKPGGPRRWLVECGLATVEVVGTAFELERDATSLRVEVQHGVVLVRGELVPDRVRRLTGGESLEVRVPETSPTPRSAPDDAIEVRAPPVLAASAGKPSTDPVGALYSEADRARQAGRGADAVRLIEEGLAQEASGHRAALRAFTLGRLYLDELGQASHGARAFERALSAGAPASLEEDIRARLVEARARSGDAAGARRAADEYRSRFPTGRRRPEVDRFVPVE